MRRRWCRGSAFPVMLFYENVAEKIERSRCLFLIPAERPPLAPSSPERRALCDKLRQAAAKVRYNITSTREGEEARDELIDVTGR
jgi:hypothetical protein